MKFPRIKFFRFGFRSGWELNFIGRHLNLRIARRQVALWRDELAIFDWRQVA